MIKPYYEEKAGIIYHGDCLEIMRDMPAERVESAIADWPFNDQIKSGLSYELQHQVCNSEIYRLLKDGGNYAVINNPSNLFRLSRYFKAFEFRNGVPLIRRGSLRPAWHLGFQHNYLWLLYKAHPRHWFGAQKNHDTEQPTDVWADIDYQCGYRGSATDWHQQAIPIELVERLIILTTEPGETVLDPFLGSGITALAARKLGRKFIGIEMSGEYCKMAADRLSQSILELT